MAIANVEISDTFGDWREVINQTVVTVNQIDSNPDVAIAAWDTTNAAYTEANTHVSLTGYAVNTTVDIVWSTANTSYDQANAAFDQANAAFNQANTNVFDQDLNTSNNVSFNEVSANTTSLSKTLESFSSIADATGVVTHDCSSGQIFYHTSIDANFTANFTNLSIANGEATSLTLVLNQGATAYIATAVQIAGASQTINWSANTQPSGNSNAIDVQSFSILRESGNYIVLGQLSTFG